MLGVESAHFAFADIDLKAYFAPESTVLKTGFVIEYREQSLRYLALALVLFVGDQLFLGVGIPRLGDASGNLIQYVLCLNKRHIASFLFGCGHQKFASADLLMRYISSLDLFSRSVVDSFVAREEEILDEKLFLILE